MQARNTQHLARQPRPRTNVWEDVRAEPSNAYQSSLIFIFILLWLQTRRSRRPLRLIPALLAAPLDAERRDRLF
jgi:hypothetical protein